MKYTRKVLFFAVVILFSSFTLIKEKQPTATISSEHSFYQNENSVTPMDNLSKALTINTTKRFVNLQPSLLITKPVAGQEYCLHQQRYIEWETSGGIITQVNIYLMKSNGQTIDRTLATNVSNNGQYLWDSTSSISGNYLIKITGSSNLTPDIITGQTGIFELKDCLKPDLQVGHIEVLPQSPGEGQRVTFKANVMNYGENPVENPTVNLQVTRPAGLPTLTFTTEIDITLVKNQGVTFEKRFRVPVQGSYKATLTLDPGNSVDEMNEYNNDKDWIFGAHALPDLIVCISNSKRPPVGRKREIRIVVKNIGNTHTNALKNIQLRSYVKQKGVKTYDIPPLERGATFTIKRNHSWGTAGTKTITAKIIYAGNEIKSNNNEVQGSFFVRLPHHDKYGLSFPVKCSTGEIFNNWEDLEN